jgi:hypothetical protein
MIANCKIYIAWTTSVRNGSMANCATYDLELSTRLLKGNRESGHQGLLLTLRLRSSLPCQITTSSRRLCSHNVAHLRHQSDGPAFPGWSWRWRSRNCLSAHDRNLRMVQSSRAHGLTRAWVDCPRHASGINELFQPKRVPTHTERAWYTELAFPSYLGRYIVAEHSLRTTEQSGKDDVELPEVVILMRPTSLKDQLITAVGIDEKTVEALPTIIPLSGVPYLAFRHLGATQLTYDVSKLVTIWLDCFRTTRKVHKRPVLDHTSRLYVARHHRCTGSVSVFIDSCLTCCSIPSVPNVNFSGFSLSRAWRSTFNNMTALRGHLIILKGLSWPAHAKVVLLLSRETSYETHTSSRLSYLGLCITSTALVWSGPQMMESTVQT